VQVVVVGAAVREPEARVLGRALEAAQVQGRVAQADAAVLVLEQVPGLARVRVRVQPEEAREPEPERALERERALEPGPEPARERAPGLRRQPPPMSAWAFSSI
jgi:hypothetical protein